MNRAPDTITVLDIADLVGLAIALCILAAELGVWASQS